MNGLWAVALLALMLVGGAGKAVAATYTYDSLNRLTKVTYDNGTSAAYTYDAAGNITEVATGQAGIPVTLTLKAGWNLMSSIIPLPSTAFGDAAKFTSLWKWENMTWAVALPGEAAAGNYANAKGFTLLTVINPGEGFWVNCTGDTSVSVTGAPIYGSLTLAAGWNLVGLRSDTAAGAAEISTGQTGVVSIWKWVGNTWAVSLPGEGVPGAYATSKGFGNLATINPGEGFWVNKQ